MNIHMHANYVGKQNNQINSEPCEYASLEKYEPTKQCPISYKPVEFSSVYPCEICKKTFTNLSGTYQEITSEEFACVYKVLLVSGSGFLCLLLHLHAKHDCQTNLMILFRRKCCTLVIKEFELLTKAWVV